MWLGHRDCSLKSGFVLFQFLMHQLPKKQCIRRITKIEVAIGSYLLVTTQKFSSPVAENIIICNHMLFFLTCLSPAPARPKNTTYNDTFQTLLCLRISYVGDVFSHHYSVKYGATSFKIWWYEHLPVISTLMHRINESGTYENVLNHFHNIKTMKSVSG